MVLPEKLNPFKFQQACELLGKAGSTVRDACKAKDVTIERITDSSILQRLANINVIKQHTRAISVLPLSGLEKV